MIQRTLPLIATGLLIGLVSATQGPAQTAQTFTACYVPEVGALYLIGLETLPDACLSPNHTEVSWTEGGGVSEHGALGGLENDDHPQYLLAEGTRQTTDGFALTRATASGSIPVEGAGVRLMWYPARAAFRAGEVTADEWDSGKIGTGSMAMGFGTTASGLLSTAFGVNTTASGDRSTALGSGTTASASQSTAMGRSTTASGLESTAMGFLTTASGSASTAMGVGTEAAGFASTAMGSGTTASGERSTAMGGFASTNDHGGTFVYGDNSTTSTLLAQAANSFVVRAQRVWFGKSGNQVATAGRYIETSTGAFLSDGGEWTNASDAALKENFRDEDAEAVLAKLAELPVRSWNYRAEDPGVRHLGPTAQDFHAAFGLGGGDRAIGTVDAAGVALLAIQALEARTRDLEELRDRIARLELENAALVAESSARAHPR